MFLLLFTLFLIGSVGTAMLWDELQRKIENLETDQKREEAQGRSLGVFFSTANDQWFQTDSLVIYGTFLLVKR